MEGQGESVRGRRGGALRGRHPRPLLRRQRLLGEGLHAGVQEEVSPGAAGRPEGGQPRAGGAVSLHAAKRRRRAGEGDPVGEAGCDRRRHLRQHTGRLQVGHSLGVADQRRPAGLSALGRPSAASER